MGSKRGVAKDYFKEICRVGILTALREGDSVG